MKIYKIAMDFANLPVGTKVLSDLYKREGVIKILDREEKKDIKGNLVIKYEVFFSNSGRYGAIDAIDISSIVQ